MTVIPDDDRQDEIDRLYLAWRTKVDESIRTGDRAACKEALRLFAVYRVARERAQAAVATFGPTRAALVGMGDGG